MAEEVERALPEFVDLVQDRRSKGVRLRLEDFEDEPYLLYCCLWYALNYGKSVRFDPGPEPKRRK
jgi:hypothetical protein